MSGLNAVPTTTSPQRVAAGGLATPGAGPSLEPGLPRGRVRVLGKYSMVMVQEEV